MDDFTDFALNEEYKRLHSVGDKLAEIESLLIGNFFIQSRTC